MDKYYVIRERAVPEVLLKVVEAKRLLEAGQVNSVQEAAERVGISRSSFYKYKDDISIFHKKDSGKLTTVILQVDDGPGIFLGVLNAIAEYQINILNIHQGISINGVANLMLVLEAPSDSEYIPHIVENISRREGVHYVKILAKE
ncbi:MAG: ACT domain-containing protein [Lachnospiraceae bacterium]